MDGMIDCGRGDIGPNDMLLARSMADTLMAHYPGHPWAVNVDGKKGVATILNLWLSERYGYTLRLVDNFSASEYTKRVLMAGGEILERFNARRGTLQPEDLSSLPTDFAGRILGDLTK